MYKKKGVLHFLCECVCVHAHTLLSAVVNPLVKAEDCRLQIQPAYDSLCSHWRYVCAYSQCVYVYADKCANANVMYPNMCVVLNNSITAVVTCVAHVFTRLK